MPGNLGRGGIPPKRAGSRYATVSAVILPGQTAGAEPRALQHRALLHYLCGGSRPNTAPKKQPAGNTTRFDIQNHAG